MTNSPSLRTQAQAGDPTAIAALMTQSFQKQGIRATAIARQATLNIYLEAATVPDRRYTQRIQAGLTSLGVDQYDQVIVHGRQRGTQNPSWSQPLPIAQSPRSPQSETAPGGTTLPRPTPTRSAPVRTPPSPRPSVGSGSTSRANRRATPTRSPLESLGFMLSFLGKWVGFSFLVSLIPTLILTQFLGLIGVALYLGVMAVLWGYTQRRLLTPMCGRDRAQQWQQQVWWGWGSAAAIVLLVRLIVTPLVIRWLNSQSALLLSNQILNHLLWLWLGVIIASIPVLITVVGFWQADWFETLRQRRWILINLGLGLCLGASVGLTFYDVINRARIGWMPLIPAFPEVLAYLIGTGLVMAYALALEQQHAIVDATADPNTDPTALKLPNFPPLPGLVALGEVPLMLVYVGIALMALVTVLSLLPNLIFLTLALLLCVAYQLGGWLHPWARRTSLIMTGVALLPFLGLAIASIGRNPFTFYLVVILAILGISLLSWLVGAIVHWRSQNLRVAGGIMFLGPTVSLTFAALIVLIAR